MCPSQSPESRASCCLPDEADLHYAGHESALADGHRVSWATRSRDWDRWGVSPDSVTEPVPAQWPVNGSSGSEASETVVESREDEPALSGHLVLEHLDGTKCIWIEASELGDGFWFVPYDASGGGAACEKDHPFMRSRTPAPEEQRRVFGPPSVTHPPRGV
jgi:hypothetical protein